MRIYLEIRACAGGKEAELFSEELLNVYIKYSKKVNMRCDLIDLGKTKTILLEGKKEHINSLLYEGGIHKVQRISKTSKKDKMHTSTVSVAILNIEENNNISIKKEELEFSSYKASGKGGQHVNTTDSAVRLKHIPTGIVVTCQNERSQLQNKEFALEILKSKLSSLKNESIQKEINIKRQKQVGEGERSEARRTYNYVRNEVIDHISNKKCSLKDFMNKSAFDSLN